MEYTNPLSVTARCPGCDGSVRTFQARVETIKSTGVNGTMGFVAKRLDEKNGPHKITVFYVCPHCFGGAVGTGLSNSNHPEQMTELRSFGPVAPPTETLPPLTPVKVLRCFREAERCVGANAPVAAVGLLRASLESVLKHNGLGQHKGNLKEKIDAAADMGLLSKGTARAAQKLRLLANSALHEIDPPQAEELDSFRLFVSRVIWDLYLERETIESDILSDPALALKRGDDWISALGDQARAT